MDEIIKVEETKVEKRGPGRPKGSKTKPKTDPNQTSLFSTEEKENKSEEKVSENKKAEEPKEDKPTVRKLRSYLVCYKCKEKHKREEMVTINGKNYCPHCAKPDEATLINKKINDMIYQLLDRDPNNTGYVTSAVHRQINQGRWDDKDVLATLNYIVENDLYSNLNGTNLFFAIQRYYGAGAKERIEEEIALARVPKNIDELLNRKVKVIEKKRSTWIRDNQLNEERRKCREYGPKIDLDAIPEDD